MQCCHLLHLSVRLRTLPDDARDAVHWDIIVSLWQAISRLIRGNANAQVFWCDAKFVLKSIAGSRRVFIYSSHELPQSYLLGILGY